MDIRELMLIFGGLALLLDHTEILYYIGLKRLKVVRFLLTHGSYCFIVRINQRDHIKNLITPHLLNAAKELIPKFWKQKIPSLRHWLVEVDQIYQMEYSTLKLKNKSELATKIWSCWFAFKFSSTFAEIMAQ